MKRVAFGFLLVVAPVLMSAQGPAKKAAPQTEAKFKAIWEPVNVKEDLALTSVHFVSPDEGWVAGGTTSMNGGVIVHTSDGGVTWETQLGDPASADRAYDHLRFLDAKDRLRRSIDCQRRSPSAADDGWEDLDAGRSRQAAPERLPVRVSDSRFRQRRKRHSAHVGRR